MITILEHQVPDYQGGGSTATLEILSDDEWTSLEDGKFHFKGSIKQKITYKRIICTVSDKILLIPPIEINSTDDSPDNPKATLTAVLYAADENLSPYKFLRNFVVPHSMFPQTTWTQLREYINDNDVPDEPDEFYTKNQSHSIFATKEEINAAPPAPAFFDLVPNGNGAITANWTQVEGNTPIDFYVLKLDWQDAPEANDPAGDGSATVIVQPDDPGAVGADVLWVNTSTAQNALQVRNKSDDDWIYAGTYIDRTMTPAGQTGARTINKPAGVVNFAANAIKLTVTNNLVAPDSIVKAGILTNDPTAMLKGVVAGNGSFTIWMTSPPLGETKVGFYLI